MYRKHIFKPQARSQSCDGTCACVTFKFERQTFEATMTISNAIIDTDLTNVNLVVNFKDKDGNPVIATFDPNDTAAKFFYKVSSLL